MLGTKTLIMLMGLSIVAFNAFACEPDDNPATESIVNPAVGDSTPASQSRPDSEGGLIGEPKTERINEKVKPPKGAVGYLADFHVYRRTFSSEVAVGAPVSHEMKVYSHFFPWEPDDHGEIARIFEQPEPIVVNDMQCQVRINQNAFGIAAAWKDEKGKLHQLYSKTHSLQLHPSKAKNFHVLKALGGGLVYLQHPTQPTEVQIFVELTPVFDRKEE